jgi:excinuclease ABC subunit A
LDASESKKLGNTVIVVEHDEEMIKRQMKCRFRPRSWNTRGKIIAQGTQMIIKNKNSLTGKYLSGKLKIERPKTRRKLTIKIY